jgi:DNA-binding NarL/FixJ family response regulator
MGLRLALEERGFEICGEAANARDAVLVATEAKPDLCLLDIHMPGNGIGAAAAIRVRVPETKVVMITVSRNDSDLFEALRAGACGYMLKDIEPDRLPDELHAALAGEAALPRGLVTKVIDEFRRRARRGWVPIARRRELDLTSREWDVLQLMREGLTTREIAKRLFITTTTVRRHVGSILKKLEVSDRDAAVRLVEGEAGATHASASAAPKLGADRVS